MFSIAFLTLDLIIILAIFIFCFFLAFTRGEYLLARFLLAFYPTTLFYLYLPFIKLATPIAQVGGYVAIFIAMIFLLKKNLTTGRSYKKSKQLFDCLILSLASILTVMTIYYHIIPVDEFWALSLPFSQYLTSVIPFGVWILVPVIALTFTHKHNA